MSRGRPAIDCRACCAELGAIDLFVHDSLHTGRNQRFELEHAWAALRPGGVAVIDDIDHSLAFRSFVRQARPRAWLAARHVTGPGLVGPEGLWGLAIKGAGEPGPTAGRPAPPVPAGRAAPRGPCGWPAGYRSEPALPGPAHRHGQVNGKRTPA